LSTTYRFEGIKLLSDLFFRLPRETAYVVRWNRWANDLGLKDSNKALDLKMEQVNKIFQMVLRRLGPNIKQPTILKYTGAALGLHEIREQFREDVGLLNLHRRDKGQDRHSDVLKVLSELLQFRPFAADDSKAGSKKFKVTINLLLSAVKRDTLNKAIKTNQAKQTRITTFLAPEGALDDVDSLTDILEGAILQEIDEQEEEEEEDNDDDDEPPAQSDEEDEDDGGLPMF